MVATYKSKTAETRTGAMANWGWSTGASGYDDEDRLVSWTRDDNNLSQSWTLTKEGDWSQFVENTTTENRTHGPAHELTSITIGSTQYNLGHDVKGNLTDIPSGLRPTASRLSWDFDNRMSAADTDGDNVDEVTLKYDALGRRVAKASGSATVVYVSMTQPIQYSPFAGQVVAEYSSGAAPASPTEKYVYASYIDEPVLKDGTGGTVYYHRNSQYSVCALTSTTGAVVERYGYEPYGELTILAADGSTVRASSSYANTYTYTGRRWDADLSLYYFRARIYSPTLGRFLSRDPLGFVPGANLFEYVRGRVAVRVDSLGLLGEDLDFVCTCDAWLDHFRNSPPRDIVRHACIRRIINRCHVHVYCSDNCGAVGGMTFAHNGYVHICIPRRLASFRLFYALLIHECVHAQQYISANRRLCRRRSWPPGRPVQVPPLAHVPCRVCIAAETPAYQAQAAYLFPNDRQLQRQWVQAGVCASCRHVCNFRQCPDFPVVLEILPPLEVEPPEVVPLPDLLDVFPEPTIPEIEIPSPILDQ